MTGFPWMWVLFGMFFWLFMCSGRRRAYLGRWSTGERSEPVDRPRGRASRVNLESELAERDALIAKLEERVRVLERIVTDDSTRSTRLREEIDALRDAPPSASP